MPRPVNKIQITGTLTMDPKMYVVEKGAKPLKVVNFPIVFDWWHGKKLEKPWYFNCVGFGYTADSAEKFLRKGSKIIITEGYLQPNKYQAKDGSWKESIKIVVDDFNMLGYNKNQTGKDIDEVAQELEDVDEVPY